MFNPQVQPDNVRDPNYFKFSDSISQPKSDQSGAITGAALGTAIEGVAGIADSTVKGIIKDDVYERVDKERTDFAQALTNTKDYGSPLGPQRSVPSAVGENGPVQAPVDILQDSGNNAPSAIKLGLGKAGTVQAAMDGNKISETTYYQRLGDIAKSLRSTYPGYREYIDTEISKITGVNPANAYISSIIQDINRQTGNATKETDFWRQKIASSGYPGWDQVLKEYERTGDHGKAAQFMAQNDGVRSNLNLKNLAFTTNQNDTTTLTARATDYANEVINQGATAYFYNTQKFANGDQSAADIADKMTDLSLHPEKINDAAYQNLSERYKALEVQATNQTMKTLFTRPKLPDGTYGKSVADVIGPEEAKKKVNAGVGALFAKTNEFISDKQFGPAFTGLNQSTAVVNNATLKVLTDSSVGGTVQTIAVMNKLAPNFAPLLTGKYLGAGLDSKLSELVTQQGAQAIAQTGGKYTGIDGKVYSFRQSLEELEQAGNISGNPIPGQAVQNLLEVRRAITDPSSTPEALTNAVKYLYDPKVNKGNLDKLMDNYYDPTKRSEVKGRQSAFADMTSPEITDKIKASGANNWAKYSEWARSEFAVQLRSQVLNLNDIERDSKFKIGWDAEKKELRATNPDGSPMVGLQATSMNLTYRTINNLNAGIRNMANIAKAEGTTVDAYIFRALKENGYTPTREADGVPAHIMRALIVGNGLQVK